MSQTPSLDHPSWNNRIEALIRELIEIVSNNPSGGPSGGATQAQIQAAIEAATNLNDLELLLSNLLAGIGDPDDVPAPDSEGSWALVSLCKGIIDNLQIALVYLREARGKLIDIDTFNQDFEATEPAPIGVGDLSDVQSFSAYSRGSATLRVYLGGAVGPASVTMRMLCRDTDDGLWVPFGNPVILTFGAGIGSLTERIIWSNQTTRDLQLEFVSSTVPGASINHLGWRFGR